MALGGTSCGPGALVQGGQGHAELGYSQDSKLEVTGVYAQLEGYGLTYRKLDESRLQCEEKHMLLGTIFSRLNSV